MVEYTPGPWTVEEYGDRDYPSLVIHRDTEHRVCFMATPGSHGDPAIIEADAHLIAAAPDLLSALRQIAAPHDCGCWPCTGRCVSQSALQITVDAMRDIAESAIAKAKVLP